MPQEISVRIDGELCRASEGQTILDVARANKKYIPTLCFLEGLTRQVPAACAWWRSPGWGACFPHALLPPRMGCP